MKSFSMFKLSTSLLAFMALVVTTSLQAAPAEAGKAIVKLVKGNPTYSNAETKLGMLKPGQVLGEGTTITTGSASIVELDLGENGKVVQIIENTTVSIDELKLEKTAADTKASTHLTLQKGGLIGNVKKLSAASDFKVKYAEGVAGIRGTKWAILPGRGVICSEGTVTVTFIVNGKPSIVTLSPGQVALPPLTPGGTPQIVSIPVDTAKFLVTLINEFGLGRDGDGPREGRGRDVRIVVSANVGNNGESGQTVEHEQLN